MKQMLLAVVDTLELAAGSWSVEEQRRVVGRPFCSLSVGFHILDSVPPRPCGRGLAHYQQAFGPNLLAALLQLAQRNLVHHQHPRHAILEKSEQLARPGKRVHGHSDCAQPQRPEVSARAGG